MDARTSPNACADHAPPFQKKKRRKRKKKTHQDEEAVLEVGGVGRGAQDDRRLRVLLHRQRLHVLPALLCVYLYLVICVHHWGVNSLISGWVGRSAGFETADPTDDEGGRRGRKPKPTPTIKRSNDHHPQPSRTSIQPLRSSSASPSPAAGAATAPSGCCPSAALASSHLLWSSHVYMAVCQHQGVVVMMLH